MKNKENVINFILIIVAIVIIAILWFVARKVNEEKTEETNQVKEEFVQVQEDGTKVNISNELKEGK